MGKLTTAQRARLEKLAAYLEGLPKRYRHFDMGEYMGDCDLGAVIDYALNNGGVQKCGTVACAVGHGPAAGILVPKRLVTKGSFAPVSWNAYSELFVGNLALDPDYRFSWLFEGDWELYDNTHYGAAARIRYLLANGGPPDGFANPARKWRRLYAPYRIDAKAPAQ
jgi:hypothetical protein